MSMLANGRDSGTSSTKGQETLNRAGIRFAGNAWTLVDNGWSPLPVQGKRPHLLDWTQFCRRTATNRKLAHWEAKFPDASIGIACGRVVALDLDIMDSSLIALLIGIANTVFGAETPLHRIGRAPRRLLVYRAAEEICSTTQEGAAGKVEVLSGGRQFVAFGIHPDIGRPYEWVGDGSPLDTATVDLPAVTAAQVQKFLQAATAIIGQAPKKPRPEKRSGRSAGPVSLTGAARWTTDERGRVVDGRDLFLFDCSQRAVWALNRRGASLTVDSIAREAWSRFTAEAVLDRAKGDGSGRPWSYSDAEAKARYALARWERGELPERRTRTERPRKGGWWTKARKDAFLAKLLADPKITGSRCKVAKAMIEDLNRQGTDLMAPSVARLVKEAGVPERTVQRVREWLEGRGYLRRWVQGWNRVSNDLKSPYRSAPYILNDAVLRDGWQPVEIVESAPSVPATSVTLNLLVHSSPVLAGGALALPDASVLPSNSNDSTAPVPVAVPAARATTAPPWWADRPQQQVLPGFGFVRQATLPAELEAWTGGAMPPAVREATRDIMRRWNLKQREAAERVGLSRPQFGNILVGKFGASTETAERIKGLLREIAAA